MFAEQRRDAILAEINRTGGARIADLGRALGVSGVTVRRDVESLAGRGLIGRVRGGGVALGVPEPADRPDPVHRRREKLAIARTASRLVRPSEAIGILAGSTTGQLARQLLDVPGLTVVTNSLPVADVFPTDDADGRTVILIGGTRSRSDALVGPVAQHTAAGINLDLLYLGVHGMTVGAGFTVSSRAEARTVALLIRASRRVVVLADHTKFGVTGAATVAPLGAADVLVTDAGMSRPARNALRPYVQELIFAEL